MRVEKDKEKEEMITSLKFISPVEVGVGNTGKFVVGDNGSEENVLSIKDIPAVRYYFKQYGENEKRFIEGVYNVFKHSVHVVEFNMDMGSNEMLAAYNMLHGAVPNMAYIVHKDITDAHAASHTFTADEAEELGALKYMPVNRLMLTDRSNSLDYIGLSKIIDEASKLSGVNKKSIGYCNSPFTTSESSCLNAALTREWAAKYNKEGEGALPSSNHNNEGSLNCGCLRYILVKSDIKAVMSGESKKKDFMNPPIKEASLEKKDNAEKKDTGDKKVVKKKPVKGLMPIW